jgi:hypothetical protein
MKRKKHVTVKIVQPKLQRSSSKNKLTSLLVELVGAVAALFFGIEGVFAQFSNRDTETALVYYTIGFLSIVVARELSYHIKRL